MHLIVIRIFILPHFRRLARGKYADFILKLISVVDYRHGLL
jgi:hypothetical protein